MQVLLSTKKAFPGMPRQARLVLSHYPHHKKRARLYQAFVMAAIPEEEWRLIRQAIQRGQLTGTERFIEEVAAKIGNRIALRGQGRPKKEIGEK